MSSECNIFLYFYEPIICLFGVITNIINISVFLNPLMKDPSFKYMMAISFSDILYLGINSYWFTYYCDDFYLNKYFSSQIYNLYLSEYLERCCAFYSLIVEIFLSLDRYLILLNRTILSDKAHKFLLIALILVALLYYVPLLFFKEIVVDAKNSKSLNNIQVDYKLNKTDLGNSVIGTYMPISLTAFRFFLNIFVLTLINSLIAYEFHKRYQLKDKLLTESVSVSSNQNRDARKQKRNGLKSRASKNITRMVLFCWIMHLIGTTPYLIYYCLIYIYNETGVLKIFGVVSSAIIFLQHGSNIFIYYIYNNKYRQVLSEYTKKLLFFK